jgi:hypothetical protein
VAHVNTKIRVLGLKLGRRLLQYVLIRKKNQ